MPPIAHNEASSIVSHNSVSNSKFSSLFSPATILVNNLYAACRANTAGRALAAGFNRTKLHGKARLLRHVHRVVEYDDATMAKHGADFDECLVVQRCVQLLRRQVRAEWATNLNSFHRAPAGGTTTPVFNEFAQRNAETFLDEAAAFDIACELEGQRSFRTIYAETTRIFHCPC